MKDDSVARKLVGHVPIYLSKVFSRFLRLPNHQIRCRVVGKRINRGAGCGLEVPVEYLFSGDVRAMNWLRGRLKSIDDELQRKLERCMR